MVGAYKVITLCGSTRFKDAFMEAQKRLTLEGYIVISVGLFGHSGDDEVWAAGTKEMLDDMHKRKIDMADEVYIINVGGYIGESTKSEILYAMGAGKEIAYLEPDKPFVPSPGQQVMIGFEGLLPFPMWINAARAAPFGSSVETSSEKWCRKQKRLDLNFTSKKAAEKLQKEKTLGGQPERWRLVRYVNV